MFEKTLRILMINDHIDFSGGGDAVFQLERKFYERSGHKVYTFSNSVSLPKRHGKNDYIYIENSSKTKRRAYKFGFNYRLYRSLRDSLERIKPDFIKLHLISKYPPSVYAALSKLNCPVVQILHGPNLFCATSWGCLKNNSSDCEMGIGLKCYMRKCISFQRMILYKLMDIQNRFYINKNIDYFICPSKHLFKSTITLNFKTTYMPLGIDPMFENNHNIQREAQPTILYVGSLIYQKGVHVLLKAFEILKQQINDAILWIAGRGAFECELKKQALKSNYSDDIHFLGFVERSKVIDIYRRAHVLAVPSIWKEQFGLVGPEALACCLPCVGSNIGGIPEWLHDNKWGYLVPPRDYKSLSERLINVLLSEKRRSEFGDRGRKFVLRKFSAQKYERNLAQYLVHDK